MTRNTIDHRMTRRAFLGGTAVLAASAVMPRGVFGDVADKPNSVFNGVRVGCITYSYRGGPNTAEYTLDCLLNEIQKWARAIALSPPVPDPSKVNPRGPVM